MVYTVLKTTFQKSEPEKLFYRDFKNFYYGSFANDLLENIDQIKKKAHSEKKKWWLRGNQKPHINKTLKVWSYGKVKT